MKSIKEKADEKYPIITGELQTYNKKFIEGANYVLKCIENIIINNEDNTLNMTRCLVDCIEQLKGNQ